MNMHEDAILNAPLFMNAHTFGISQMALAGSCSTVGASLILWLALAVEGLVTVFPKSCTRCSSLGSGLSSTTLFCTHLGRAHIFCYQKEEGKKKKKSTKSTLVSNKYVSEILAGSLPCY